MADFLKHTLGISERVFYANSVADWFRILDEFRHLGVRFAYPTQRVLVENQTGS